MTTSLCAACAFGAHDAPHSAVLGVLCLLRYWLVTLQLLCRYQHTLEARAPVSSLIDAALPASIVAAAIAICTRRLSI